MNPLEEAARSRDIKYLFHFTRLANLQNILGQGLIPRSQLESAGINVIFNDENRLDGCPNSTCLSINFPNYKMFWTFRKRFEDVVWVILAIDPIVLWQKDCAFCHENAASNAVTIIPLYDRKGIDGFNRLYEEIDDKPGRKQLGISEGAPTNPQAEVLVFDIIEPAHFAGVIVENKIAADEVREQCPGTEPEIVKGLFKARKGFEHWM